MYCDSVSEHAVTGGGTVDRTLKQGYTHKRKKATQQSGAKSIAQGLDVSGNTVPDSEGIPHFTNECVHVFNCC